jgi:hypothetical protein
MLYTSNHTCEPGNCGHYIHICCLLEHGAVQYIFVIISNGAMPPGRGYGIKVVSMIPAHGDVIKRICDLRFGDLPRCQYETLMSTLQNCIHLLMLSDIVFDTPGSRLRSFLDGS